MLDKFIIFSSYKVFCDSKSQSDFIANQLKVKKPTVIGKGSISGVNLKKFNFNKIDSLKLLDESILKKKTILKQIIYNSYKNNLKIILFIGRLNKDKGIIELIDGFKSHNRKFRKSYLLLIGPNELTKQEYKKVTRSKNCYHLNSFCKEINLFMSLSHCLILPSYREGFGSVIIEAAASKLPIIATNISGPRDFIEHMKNGFLINPKSSKEISNALDFFQENKKLIKIFASNSFKKCQKNYSEQYVCNSLVKEILKEI
tara:strand:+ start:17 stop:790 length:774 start_codon:yes stop_codon:yes gene_type:complete